MLTQDQIVKNTKKYFETANKHGFMTEELTKFLGESFIKAPATHLTSYYNAFEGGLIQHLLKTAKYAIGINNSLPEEERVPESSLIKVCLLHQIGKAHLFKPNTSEWHRTNQGKMYDFNDELVSMRIGERSVFYAMSHGVKLTDQEYSAIIFFDKSDTMSEIHNSMLGELLKMGSTLAIKNEKRTSK